MMKKIIKNSLVSALYGIMFCMGIIIFLFGIKARSGITSTPGDKLTSTKRNELITKLTSLETKTQNISTNGTSFSGVNIGYEVISYVVPQGASTSTRYYATCPAGKKALGGACSSRNGSYPTNTQLFGDKFGCYNTNNASSYTIRVICANVN